MMADLLRGKELTKSIGPMWINSCLFCTVIILSSACRIFAKNVEDHWVLFLVNAKWAFIFFVVSSWFGLGTPSLMLFQSIFLVVRSGTLPHQKIPLQTKISVNLFLICSWISYNWGIMCCILGILSLHHVVRQVLFKFFFKNPNILHPKCWNWLACVILFAERHLVSYSEKHDTGPGWTISTELCGKSCVIGQIVAVIYAEMRTEMHSDSNFDIFLQLVHFHYLVFASAGGDMITFWGKIVWHCEKMCTFVQFVTKNYKDCQMT